MTSMENNNEIILWKESLFMWGAIIGAVLLLILAAHDGLSEMVRAWETREEYSHGYMIPVITLFLIWQKSDHLSRMPFVGSWYGLGALIIGITIILIGNLGAIATVIQYGFLISLISVAFALTGVNAFKQIIIPLLILGFMMPLPSFVLLGLSSELQLISSQLGVAVIRLFDISVYLEGNVIDLGSYKLQVVEACSGLNYLFPLMSLAFVAAYFYHAPIWKRAIIFLSSIPVTILMNSFRIGVIGVLVEYWGQSQAEGFLHDFEGWVVFMACIAILILEMWLLNKIGGNNKSLQEVFGFEFPESPPESAQVNKRKLPTPFKAVMALLVIASAGIFALGKNENIIPERENFIEFPMVIGEWNGKRDRLEQIYLDALKLDDYVIADYHNSNGEKVNFYSAYYETQQAGEAAHSPRTCIPGGGWRIKSHDQKIIKGLTSVNGGPLSVNRLLIQKGDFTQVVYYWFKMRERNQTSEYSLKLYLIWDAITRNRTDMALVRFTTVSMGSENIADADARIESLLNEVYPVLNKYIPE
ncbi:MAG: VPLPA-CTERM-specific exosortase XrtD [Gammaproteobacteria bacterium]|nr:VPLPA-CTERM-specific exosortase XrtD [Gammaproteobacteria bacterium]